MKPFFVPCVVALLLGSGSTVFAEPEPMEDMAATMSRIQATQDPEERERLLEQHMAQMQEHMGQMHSEMSRMEQQMSQMMAHMHEQQREAKRLHDHRKMK